MEFSVKISYAKSLTGHGKLFVAQFGIRKSDAYSKMKISATVLAVDEIEKLPKALESLNGWVNEIILVIDPKTKQITGKIEEIGRKFGAKVFIRKLDTFANQKNFAADKTSGDW